MLADLQQASPIPGHEPPPLTKEFPAPPARRQTTMLGSHLLVGVALREYFCRAHHNLPESVHRRCQVSFDSGVFVFLHGVALFYSHVLSIVWRMPLVLRGHTTSAITVESQRRPREVAVSLYHRTSLWLKPWLRFQIFPY